MSRVIEANEIWVPREIYISAVFTASKIEFAELQLRVIVYVCACVCVYVNTVQWSLSSRAKRLSVREPRCPNISIISLSEGCRERSLSIAQTGHHAYSRNGFRDPRRFIVYMSTTCYFVLKSVIRPPYHFIIKGPLRVVTFWNGTSIRRRFAVDNTAKFHGEKNPASYRNIANTFDTDLWGGTDPFLLATLFTLVRFYPTNVFTTQYDCMTTHVRMINVWKY